LPEKHVQEGLRLSGRGIEHIYRSQSTAAGPAIRGDPARFGMRSCAGDLARDRMTISGQAVIANSFQRHLVTIKIKCSAIAVVQCRGNIRSQFLLQYEPKASGVQVASFIAESA
jgi:hypothetical protein